MLRKRGHASRVDSKMAIGCRFLLSGLWFCFVFFRICHAHEFVQDNNSELLFAPRHLAVRSPSALCTWRVNSHLRPWASSSRRRNFVLPNCYWLILLAGDVETNPGPAKYPCTACSKAVRNNQRGIFCSMCENWTHARCCGIGADEYNMLSELGDSSAWYCPRCIARQLPFWDLGLSCESYASSSDASTETSRFVDGLVDISADEQEQEMDQVVPFGRRDGSLVLGHLNIRSLFNKLDELQVFLENRSRALVLGLSETWLDSSLLDAELEVPGFSLYRKDRNRRGGGVMVYVSNDVKAVRRGDVEEVGIEALWIEVKTSKMRMLVCNVYRPPDAKAEWIDEVAGMIEHAVQEGKTVVVLGDFNCDMLRPNSHACRLGMVMSEYGLEQLGNGPTRVTENSSTQIDLLFSTSSEVFQHVDSEDPGLSDHSLIYGLLTCRVQGNKQKLRNVRCLGKCDIEKLVSSGRCSLVGDGCSGGC